MASSVRMSITPVPIQKDICLVISLELYEK